MALYRITLTSIVSPVDEDRFKSNHDTHAGNQHRQLAAYLAKRLRSLSRALDERGMVFEASDAEDLIVSFNKLAQSHDTDAETFAMTWAELEDWCGQTVGNTSGKSVELCSLPTLPRRFGC